MSEPIIVIDSSEVQAGKLDEVKEAMKELADFVAEREPRVIAYNVYFTRDGSRMTVVQTHFDSTSLEHHMKVAGPLFRPLAGKLRMMAMDIYGQPSEELMVMMRKKAEMMGDPPVVVQDLHAGFTRAPVDPGAIGETLVQLP